MSEPGVRSIDLFKIAGESISGMSSLRNESELSSRKRLYTPAASGDQNVDNVSSEHLINTSSKIYLYRV